MGNKGYEVAIDIIELICELALAVWNLFCFISNTRNVYFLHFILSVLSVLLRGNFRQHVEIVLWQTKG